MHESRSSGQCREGLGQTLLFFASFSNSNSSVDCFYRELREAVPQGLGLAPEKNRNKFLVRVREINVLSLACSAFRRQRVFTPKISAKADPEYGSLSPKADERIIHVISESMGIG